MQGRWNSKKLQLVDQKSLEKLMKSSMYHLFSSEHGLWSYVESEEDIFEELGSLNVLLSWLAWQVGYDFTPSIPPAWQKDRVERDFLFIGNAYIGKLFPRLILDQLEKPLELALHSTIEAVPKQKALASSWLNRNLSLGNDLLTGFSVSSTDRSAKSAVGGFAYVPNKIDPWTVVLDVDDRLVRVWDFEADGKDGIVSKGFLKQVVLSYEAHSV
jgi:hypothetical protein